MVFSGSKLSDFTRVSYTNKKHLKRCYLKNGVAGKLVRWRCTPQPYGLAVQRLLAFPRRTSAGSVTGHCFASPTLRQLSTITKNLREGGFLLRCAILCNYRTKEYEDFKDLSTTINFLFADNYKLLQP